VNTNRHPAKQVNWSRKISEIFESPALSTINNIISGKSSLVRCPFKLGKTDTFVQLELLQKEILALFT
jgi:hypothetical protein